MSDEDNISPGKPFSVETAKQGRAVCKKCKQKCIQGDLRIAKLAPNSVGLGKMKIWYHIDCIFEVFLKQRQTTKRIETPQDIEGWDLLNDENKTNILKKIDECNEAFEAKLNKSPKKTKRNNNNNNNEPKAQITQISTSDDSLSSDGATQRDNCFREFRIIIAKVSNESNSTEKINIFRDFFSKGSDGTGFKGDIILWCKLLLPAIIKRVFHLQTKQLVKIFSRIFNISEETMTAHLDQGDVGLTIQYFFERNEEFKPIKRSTLTIYDIDEFLESLTKISKEEDQYNHFRTFIKRCTSNDLKVVIRLIKHDLRMNAGVKHVFKGLHPDAYLIFQSCRDIKTVINTCWKNDNHPVEIQQNGSKRKTSVFEPEETTNKRLKEDEAVETKLEESTAPAAAAAEIPERRKSVPTYFEGVKLYLEEGVIERHALWVRYFIAFGGTVLKSDEHEEATHVLHLRDTIVEPTIQCVNSARHIIVEWIKDTVAKEELQDYKPYTVRWNPSFKI